MEKFLLRLLLIIVLISFGVFYGIDMAGRGMDRVQDVEEAVDEPGVQLPADSHLDIIEMESAASETEPISKRPFTYQIDETRAAKKSTGWAGKLGEILQHIAHGAVEGINSIFDRIVT